MKKLITLVAAIFALVVPTSASADTFYMDTNGGMCVPVVFYEDAKACGTMQAAYSAAKLGDEVLIRPGNYPEQIINANVSKGAPDTNLDDVLFRGDGPADQIAFAAVRIYVPHVYLWGFEVNGMLTCRYKPEDPSKQQSGDCHFDQMRVVDGGRTTFAAVKNFSMRNSLIANNWRDGIDIYGSDSGAADVGHYPQFGLIENNVIRDLRLIDSDHIDGIQFTTGLDVAIVNNKLGPNIHHQGILAKTDRGPVSRIRIEGNEFFDVVDPGFSLSFHRWNLRECKDNSIVGNIFHRPPTPRNGPDDQCSGVMSGNTFSSMSTFACQQWLESWQVFDNTFLSGEPCGTVGEPTPPPPPPPPADSDGDGVPDSEDNCPTESGPAENQGCPLPPPPADTDSDGVPDSEDSCPTEAGPVENQGCPLPPPPYEPACAPTCDEQIEDLTSRLNAAEAQNDALTVERDACRSKIARANTRFHGSGTWKQRAQGMHAILHDGGACVGFSP